MIKKILITFILVIIVGLVGYLFTTLQTENKPETTTTNVKSNVIKKGEDEQNVNLVKTEDLLSDVAYHLLKVLDQPYPLNLSTRQQEILNHSTQKVVYKFINSNSFCLESHNYFLLITDGVFYGHDQIKQGRCVTPSR